MALILGPFINAAKSFKRHMLQVVDSHEHTCTGSYGEGTVVRFVIVLSKGRHCVLDLSQVEVCHMDTIIKNNKTQMSIK
jgi:hypothetical protein